MVCPYCSSVCIRFGKSSAGKKRFRCKSCKKTHIKDYSYQACNHQTSNWIRQLLKEGNSIRGISRLLNISVTTVLRRILRIAKNICKPAITVGKEYEMDELCTYIKKKTRQIWIVYAMRKDTKQVIDFAIGARTVKTLRCVTNTLLLSDAAKIYTDKLCIYRSLLPVSIHKTTLHGTNHIERKNLDLRIHLKRLNRRTICFSKSTALLSASLKIYFWG